MVLSVIGSSKGFNIHPRLKRLVRDGIERVIDTTDAVVVTSGLVRACLPCC